MVHASTDSLAHWQERGFVVLRRAQWLGRVMGPRGEHLATLADEVAELPAANRTRGVAKHGPFHSYEIVADGSDAVRLSRTEAFVDHHRGLDAFLRGGGSPLARLVARLAGERVSLYKDKLNYKFPGGGGYVPHQDGYDGLGVPQYVSPAQRGFIAYVAMIAVDDTTLANGCAQVAPATWARKEGWLDFHSARHNASFDYMGPYQPVELAAGDVLIYDNFMPHMSFPNLSRQKRRALFAIYYGAETTPRDLRGLYYQLEARSRRARSRRANIYHTGEPAGPPGELGPTGSAPRSQHRRRRALRQNRPK